MPAYLISDITLRDRGAFEVYRTRAADAIHKFGGRYLAVWEKFRHLRERGIPASLWSLNFQI